MSLETLEGLPAEVAALYKKGEDGKFSLEGDGLKSALQKERERANAAEKALKAREQAEAEAKSAKEREDLERKGEYEKLSAKSQAELDALKKALADRDAALDETLKDAAAVAALGAAGLKVNRLLLAELKGSLEVVQGKVLVKGDPSKTADQLLSSLKEDPELAGLFPASGNGGGSHQPDGKANNAAASAFDPKNPAFNYTKQMEIAQKDPAMFESLRAQFPQP